MTTAKSTSATDGNFSFTHNGERYVFEKSLDVVRTPKWLRANRRRDELDLAFTLLEELAGEKALEAIDEMTSKEFEALQKRLNEAFNKAFA